MHVTSVDYQADGTSVLTGNPVTVHCGGPDGRHFVTGTQVEAVHLIAGGELEIFSTDTMKDVPVTSAQLSRNPTAGGGTAIFQVTGTLTNATAVIGEYSP